MIAHSGNSHVLLNREMCRDVVIRWNSACVWERTARRTQQRGRVQQRKRLVTKERSGGSDFTYEPFIHTRAKLTMVRSSNSGLGVLFPGGGAQGCLQKFRKSSIA